MSYPSPRRSIFITLSSVLLIVLVTLLPFNFTAEGVTLEFAVQSFFYHSSGFSDIVGNVFLFLPFGLDLAYEFRQRRVKKHSALFLTVALSTLLSFTVETLQVFLPWRASSWIDICTNTLGGMLGAMIYLSWCQLFPNGARTIAFWIRRRLSPQLLASLLILWIAVVFGICFYLQQRLKFGTWDFSIASLFMIYGFFFVPLGILLALMFTVLRGDAKFYLALSGMSIVLPGLMIELFLRGSELRETNLLVSIMIPFFTMLVVRSRLGYLFE
ncbi:VanZ family protein [Leptolyngbya sp. AN03gr2]|uniref:VanZ family protein n=1 Tax=unclassified Leptolyngbya TaxID=2650499 RepID=UPI003D313DD4